MQTITRDNCYFRLAYFVLLLCAVTIPFTRFFLLPAAVVLLLLLVIDNRWKLHFQTIKRSHLQRPFVWTTALFLLCVIGTFYSTNVAKAFSDWEYKLWFLVVPCCLFPLAGKFTVRQLRWLMLGFICATLCCAIGNIVISTANFARTHDLASLLYTRATQFNHAMHPSYFALYCTFAWLLCIELMLKKWQHLSLLLRLILVMAVVIFSVEILLLQSKAGIIFWGLCMVGELLRLANYRRRRLFTTLLVVVAAGSVATLIMSTDNIVSHRLLAAAEVYKTSDRTNPTNGTMQRIAIWETATELAVENLPFGVGTGDIVDNLFLKYQQKGYTYILERKLNCHCQFLQYFIGLGIPGILVFLLFLCSPIWEGIRRKDFLLLMWGLIISGNMFVESMFDVKAGSTFIPLTLGLLWIRNHAMPTAGELSDDSRKDSALVFDEQNECGS